MNEGNVTSYHTVNFEGRGYLQLAQYSGTFVMYVALTVVLLLCMLP